MVSGLINCIQHKTFTNFISVSIFYKLNSIFFHNISFNHYRHGTRVNSWVNWNWSMAYISIPIKAENCPKCNPLISFMILISKPSEIKVLAWSLARLRNISIFRIKSRIKNWPHQSINQKILTQNSAIKATRCPRARRRDISNHRKGRAPNDFTKYRSSSVRTSGTVTWWKAPVI